ncbi:ABC transporter permease [Halovivax limisalsi]|uniref:ABC transporter permease n=1 Tax=Halovivax limisalsi TaxID=1453760 RepID=UPI001FFCC62C|nr:ABC transporter permease [Halovivax limisalsi]
MSDPTTTEANDRSVAARNSLRERILENPRPALVWFGVFAFLILIELPKYAGSVGGLTGAVSFTLDGIKQIPGWIGGNVGDGIASAVSAIGMSGVSEPVNTIASAFAHDLIVIGILFVVATLISGYVLPWHVADRFGLDLTRRGRVYLDRLFVTGILTVLTGLLAFTPLGGIVSSELSFWGSIFESIGELPSLTDRNVIDNVGHRSPTGSGWEGTFLGLSPKWAWVLRVVVVYAYAFALLAWLWKGYNVFREHYREADWTPRDDTIRRFRGHTWGMFGLVVVVMFVVLGFWAPTISPVTAETGIYGSYQHEFQYLSDGEVVSSTHGAANVNSHSTGGSSDVGPWSYDDYGRWQPAGTTPNGHNMMTHLAYGAQTSLIIGIVSISLGGLIALLFSLISAYYKGVADTLVVMASDTIISIPAFLLVMMISVLFNQSDHPLSEPMDGGLLLALIFGFVFWPSLWRSIRGPSLQVAEEEWIDAAKSYGQRPLTTMRKHMAPYVAGYMLIYASLILGGIIITTAALSFLGLGINPPTPEWGRLIASGQPYLSQGAWHISTISGLMIVLVVLAFNALGDGLRDAIDPEADIESGEGGAAAGGGG